MSEPEQDDHRDRSLGLAIFGAVQVGIGLLCAALVPLTVVGVVVSPEVNARIAFSSVVVYGAVAAIFVTLGVGSIRARRWAQALSLSLAWVWLITGVGTVLLMWLVLPTLWHDLARGAGLDEGTAHVVAVGVHLVLLVVYVLLPGVMVLFYRSPDVVATCRARDPDPGWAGRCPQPLLALAVAYGLGALSIAGMPAYGFVFPFFGRLLSGTVGALAWAVVTVVCLALARGTVRREPWAWWTAVVTTVAAAVSTLMTFTRIDSEAVLHAMHLPIEQQLIMEQMWPSSPWVQSAVWLTLWGSLLAYLAIIRPLFEPPLGRGEVGP
jgi:hypothetical protein